MQSFTSCSIILFLLLSPLYGKAQEEAVGVYTENPQGVFHLDAHTSGRVNPATGAPTPAQQADDVVISTEGRVGIGVTTPSTRLEINTQGQTSVVHLRIQDGSQGNGKRLTSDAQGVASWETLNIAGVERDTVYPVRVLAQQSFTKATFTQVGSSSFTAPANGFYGLEVRWWGDFNAQVTPAVKSVFIFQLRKNGTTVDEIVWHEFTIYRTTAYVCLYAKASQNDVLTLYVNPVAGPGSSYVIGAMTSPWTKSKLLYKKLGIDDGASYFD
jgi:hypothetical protein